MNSERTYFPVATLADLPEGALRMVRVGGRRLCLVSLSTGVHAIDNACPHEGYGLTQGDLSGDVLTCIWHNWKFNVTSGECVQGEEDVVSHHVRIDADGTVSVALRVSDPTANVPKLYESLRSGIERDFVGQISRDVIRLLKSHANPGELVWEAIAFGAPRTEFGWGHSMAVAADCLAVSELFESEEKALPIVQAIAGISESERNSRTWELPPLASSLPVDSAEAFRSLVEVEDLKSAQSLVRAAIHGGTESSELQAWFTSVVCDHHLSYGHGAIYVQKAFELLDMLGWDRADTVLPHLVPTIVYGTREDKLPYMKPFMKRLRTTDLSALLSVSEDPDWEGRTDLVESLLGGDRMRAFDNTVMALRQGAGVNGILDAAVVASSERLLRYDVAGERDFLDDFGWLDITHGVTYAHAARWHHERSPGADTLQLAFFATFLAHYTGRHEWHTQVADRSDNTPLDNNLHTYGMLIQKESLRDHAASFIVQAHMIKNSRAAAIESEQIGSDVPLLAAQRFLEAPKLQRFVASTVARSLEFLNGRDARDQDR